MASSNYYINSQGDIKTSRDLQKGPVERYTIEGHEVQLRRGPRGQVYGLVGRYGEAQTAYQPFKREALKVMGILARHDFRSHALRVLSEAPRGTRINLILKSVSRSGMCRHIKAFVCVGEGLECQTPSLGALVNDFPEYLTVDDEGAFIMGGCGMDMGFALVYNLGMDIHGDGYYFQHNWM